MPKSRERRDVPKSRVRLALDTETIERLRLEARDLMTRARRVADLDRDYDQLDKAERAICQSLEQLCGLCVGDDGSPVYNIGDKPSRAVQALLDARGEIMMGRSDVMCERGRSAYVWKPSGVANPPTTVDYAVELPTGSDTERSVWQRLLIEHGMPAAQAARVVGKHGTTRTEDIPRADRVAADRAATRRKRDVTTKIAELRQERRDVERAPAEGKFDFRYVRIADIDREIERLTKIAHGLGSRR